MIRSTLSCRQASTCAGFLLAVSLTPALLAQQPDLPAQQGEDAAVSESHLLTALERGAEPLVPVHTAEPDSGYEYGVWGAGPGYKISFHDGATFVPMLGRDYPHNQPWSWSTTSARVGDRELVRSAAQLSYEGHRAEYALGGIVEAYDLRRDGVEQTFVIDAHPGGGTGDLVIRGVVRSMLRSAPVEAVHGGLSFVDAAGRECVTYGAATAVDAAGARMPMTTSFVGGELTLRLDGDWLANAAFPVVVDPLLAGGGHYSGPTRYSVDLVRDSETSTEATWMAYSYYASATDRDLWGVRWNDNGTTASVFFQDVTSTWSSEDPSCAYNASANSAVVAFQRVFLGGTSGVRLHRHLRSDFGWNTGVNNVPASDNCWRPDVGGTELNNAGENVLVTYQQENNNFSPFQNTSSSAIYGVTYSALDGSWGAPFLIAGSLFSDSERPSINQVSLGNTNGNTWLVAYQSRSTLMIVGGTPADWNIYVREVDVFGNVSSATAIDAGNDDHQFAPQIAGQNGRYLVGFVTDTSGGLTPQGTNGRQLRVTRLDWTPGSGVGTQPWGTVVLNSTGDARNDFGGLAFNRTSRSHWGVLLRSTVTQNLYLYTVGYSGMQVTYDIVHAPAGSDTTALGGLTFNEFNEQFLIGYAENGTPNYVTLDRFAPAYVPPPSTSGVACSTATIGWSGSQQIGNDQGAIVVNGAAPDSIHALVMATSTASAVLFGIGFIEDGCWLLVPNVGPDHVGIFDLRLGSNVAWNLPLPEFLAPGYFYFQDFHTIGGGDFTFRSTQRLLLNIGK